MTRVRYALFSVLKLRSKNLICQSLNRNMRERAECTSFSLAHQNPGGCAATGLHHCEKKLMLSKKYKMKWLILTNLMLNIFWSHLEDTIIQPMTFDYHYLFWWLYVNALLNQNLYCIRSICLLCHHCGIEAYKLFFNKT